MTIATRESWKRLREMVKRRDKSICYHCGKLDEKGHCDHLIPLSKGGTDSILNLVWSCAKCNRAKGSKILDNLDYEIESIEDEEVQTFSIKKGIKAIVEKLVSFIISPYPDYNYLDYPDYLDYFKEIDKLRIFPISEFIRKNIWPTPRHVSIILNVLDNYYKISKAKVSIIEDEETTVISNEDLLRVAISESHRQIFGRPYRGPENFISYPLVTINYQK